MPLLWISRTPTGRCQGTGLNKHICCAAGLVNGKRKLLAFLRAAQGSLAAGTLWGPLAALVMRLTQSLVDPTELRLVCYVDDPLAPIRGIPSERRMFAAILVLVWEAIGFKLAYAKGQLDGTVTWIDGTLTIDATWGKATVKSSIIEDIPVDFIRFMALRTIPKKEIHSLIGKLGHAAGLLIVMRPLLDPLLAAWAALGPAGHPACGWTRHVTTEMHWFYTFFNNKGAKVERYFSLDAFNRVGTVVEIGTDASPWGMGGWLSIDGAIAH